ncbi:helix-turn-helix domain-containing protein [Thermosediminibacter litoriperuensis]|uniref:Zn-dependent peptidase ImmA (M78 family) n=1 Tax=Thermosediminibacter litoriperuensis TaxID=291989 RepID=A0A5S5AVS5_9FIRM|nr:XRE family transcriptional regulator [Thermosediminibacter litoriperuensis]TYP57439.1 Zn-dependent peptidase ImmA (M78 family) [Thermosediminibacter litoriperuensis]
MIGERIRYARQAAGLSLRDLAKKIGVSHTAIAKYEKNRDIPSSAVLIRLAEALDVNVDYFFRSKNVKLCVYAYRKKASLSKKNEKRVTNQIRDWIERYLDIEEILGINVPNFVVPSTLSKRINKMDDIEKLAQTLRDEWELGTGPINNLTELLEEKGIKVGLIEGLDDFDSCIILEKETGPIIVTRKDLPGDRQRFNLAHELGHLIIEVDECIDLEKAAHRFAGAFLVPEKMVIQELGRKRHSLDLYELHLLKHKYGLSVQGWIYRAKDLNIISDKLAAKLFKLFKLKGWHQQEPGDPYPPEKPQRLERLVLKALSEKIIGETKAAEIVGRPLEEFWREAGIEHQWEV